MLQAKETTYAFSITLLCCDSAQHMSVSAIFLSVSFPLFTSSSLVLFQESRGFVVLFTDVS